MVGTEFAFGQKAAHKIDGTQFGEQTGVEIHLVHAVHDFRHRVRNVPMLDRVDLHQQNIAGLGFVQQWIERRVAGITAIPIRLASDLDRLENQRQTGRSHHDIDTQLRP